MVIFFFFLTQTQYPTEFLIGLHQRTRTNIRRIHYYYIYIFVRINNVIVNISFYHPNRCGNYSAKEFRFSS